MYIFDRIMDLIIPDKWRVYDSYTTISFFRNKGNINSKHAIMIIKAPYDVTAALWRHVDRGCLGDISNEDFGIHRKQPKLRI